MSDLPAFLIKVQTAFSDFRELSLKDNPHYPQELKLLAISAIEQGASVVQIAQAANVTRNSITNWRQRMDRNSIPLPKELLVVENDVPCLDDSHSSLITKEDLARICLESGVIIELPATALSGKLLNTLLRVGTA